MFGKKKKFVLGDMTKILEGYEGKWVTLYSSKKQIIISGSGNTISEAIEESLQKGISDTVLIRVPEKDVSYIF